jgi:O-antigen ligase
MHKIVLENKKSLLDQISVYLVIGILTTLALSALNLNTYLILTLLFLTIIRGNFKKSLKTAWDEPFFRSCVLIFLLFVAGIFYATSWQEGIDSAERRLELLTIPFIFCSQQFAKVLKWQKIMFVFCIILLLISLYLLVIAFIHFLNSGETNQFFYHELVKPLSQHAIYFSVLVFITIVFLLEENDFMFLKIRYAYYPLLIYLLFFIVLLSSKLVLTISVVYVLYKLLHMKKIKVKWYIYLFAVLISAGFIIFTKNSVKARFSDISNFDIEKFRSSDLSAAYFNGVEFRLIQWKLTFEILNDQKAWLMGVSPADAQSSLVKKYKEYHFYGGNPLTGSTGYFGYNSHNQFLQCLLQSGLIGLGVFLYACYSLVRLGIRDKGTELRMCILLLIAFCFTESVLQTQKGLVTFTLFPLLIYYDSRRKVR